jgi:mRNA interferase RelE/StbE
MTWQIDFDKNAAKELKKLDNQVAVRILKFLKEKLLTAKDPRELGEALKGSKLGEFWKYRIGSYRIITEIIDNKMTILVIKIGDRKEVYKH